MSTNPYMDNFDGEWFFEGAAVTWSLWSLGWQFTPHRDRSQCDELKIALGPLSLVWRRN